MQVRCYPRAFAPLANPTQWVSSTNSQATAFTPNPMRNALTFSMLADVPLNLYSGSCGSRQKTPEISLPKWQLWQIRSLKRFRKCQRHPSRRLHMMQMTQNDRPGAFMKIPGKIRGQGKSGYRRDVPHFQDVPKVFHRNLFHFCDQQPLLRNLNRPNWSMPELPPNDSPNSPGDGRIHPFTTAPVSIPKTGKPASAQDIKSFVRKILLTSPDFPRLYADVVIASAPNSFEAKILAQSYEKIVAYYRKDQAHVEP